MSSKRRTIEPDLFAHPAFRRASFIERELWIGLITLADDEGRLRVDPVTLCETIFSPLCHKVTERKVADALQFWSQSKETDKVPWLLLYGDVYGYLTGWYEHQYIKPDEREESSLPPPPVPVCSWVAADAVYRWYCRSQGQKKTYYRLAIRALTQLTVAEQSRIVAEELRNFSATVTGRSEGKGSEGKGRTRNRNSDAQLQPDPEPEKQPEPDPTDAPDLSRVDTCNNAVYSAAWHYWQGNGNPPKGREDWCRLLVVQSENAGIRKHLDDDAIVEAFRTSPPRAAEWPDGWLERLCKERERLTRQDPAAASDPAIAECIRRYGPKPEDLFDLREWGEWLKGIRAELAGQEAAL